MRAMLCSAARSSPQNVVITAIANGRPGTNTIPASLRTASRLPGLLAIIRSAGSSRGM